MKAQELKDGIKVCHTKYNRLYKVVSCNMRLKDSVLGWIDAVVYEPLYANEYDCFCREKESFLAEFEIVER